MKQSIEINSDGDILLSDGETTTRAGATDWTTRYDIVTRVQLIGINSSSDTLFAQLSRFKALKVVDIQEAAIDVTTTEATSMRLPLANLKTLTLKNVLFSSENMTSIAEFLQCFESTQELTVTDCSVEAANVTVNSSRDVLLSDNTDI